MDPWEVFFIWAGPSVEPDVGGVQYVSDPNHLPLWDPPLIRISSFFLMLDALDSTARTA